CSVAAGFIMIKLRVRRKDDPVSCAPKAQAVIDVVEIDREGFAESADLVKHVTSSHHARAGYRRVVSRSDRRPGVARIVAWRLMKYVSRAPADAEDNARVLQATIRKIQLRADRANFRILRVLEHRRQPLGRDDLDVIVENQEVLALRVRDGEIQLVREVERLANLVRDSPMPD